MAEQDELSPILIEDEILAEGFVQVPVAVVFDPDLSAGAKTTYGALLWYAWKLGGAPAQTVMAEHLGGGRRTIQRHLSDLERAGYIETRILGLGRPNEYIIKSLRDRQFAGAPKMAHQVRHNRRTKDAKNGASPRTTLDRTTNTLSHRASAPDLADAFFAAIGERKPAARRRERALEIIHELTAEGFTADAIREACKLAGERGARGPDLLPYLIGEAHSQLEAQTTANNQQAQVTATAEKEQQEAAERHSEGLALVEALSPDDRLRLEVQARVALGLDPERHNGPASQAVITGWIMTRLRDGVTS